MTTQIAFQLNGAERTANSDPDTPLLLALRNELGARGTRQGCGTGNCGACTVLVDGRAVTSCTMPLEAVAGRSVETIETLAGDAVGKALLAAFMAEQAGQCGYCLAGILLQAKAFLGGIEHQPSRTEIATALDGHLCRCGAHHRILNAVARAAIALQIGAKA